MNTSVLSPHPHAATCLQFIPQRSVPYSFVRLPSVSIAAVSLDVRGPRHPCVRGLMLSGCGAFSRQSFVPGASIMTHAQRSWSLLPSFASSRKREVGKWPHLISCSSQTPSPIPSEDWSNGATYTGLEPPNFSLYPLIVSCVPLPHSEAD